MENQQPAAPLSSGDGGGDASLVATFCEITSAPQSEAIFYLESHNYDLDSALSTYLETTNPTATATVDPVGNQSKPVPDSPVQSESYSPSQSQSQSQSSTPPRSRSPSPPPARRSQYNLRSSSGSKPSSSASARGGSRRDASGIRTLADLNRQPSGSDSDEPQEYYTGGEKSGMLVQDPSKANNVDAIFDHARRAGGVERPADSVQPSSSSQKFTGTARLLSGETVSQPSPPLPAVNHAITFWRNGFTVDDGPLQGLEDPENASFLESIRRGECPMELRPTNMSTPVHVSLVRRDENYVVRERPQRSFQGVGRTLGSQSDTAAAEPAAVDLSMTSAPTPTLGLVVDEAQPSTSIQLRLADGTRMVSRFNYHHTVRDIRGFIDASRPGGSGAYQLQTVGFPPKPLTDLDQTIEQAGLANSVVIQKPC